MIIMIKTLRKHAHVIYRDFKSSKSKTFNQKKIDIFLIFVQNIDCGGSNEYPQSMSWSKNKKK